MKQSCQFHMSLTVNTCIHVTFDSRWLDQHGFTRFGEVTCGEYMVAIVCELPAQSIDRTHQHIRESTFSLAMRRDAFGVTTILVLVATPPTLENSSGNRDRWYLRPIRLWRCWRCPIEAIISSNEFPRIPGIKQIPLSRPRQNKCNMTWDTCHLSPICT